MVEMTDEDNKPPSTGFAQAEAVVGKVQQWGCVQRLTALVFDTTASNTGKFRGAAIRLHRMLQVALFFLGCRHHVSELVR